MSTQETQKKNPCILKVYMDCKGCAKKVQKLLLKIEGVKDVQTNIEQWTVLVVGDVDPNELIQTLKNSKKVAEIFGGGFVKEGGNHIEGENSNGGGRKSRGGFVGRLCLAC